MMKRLIAMMECAVLAGMLVCVSPLVSEQPAEAQWQVPADSIPLGGDAGTGFKTGPKLFYVTAYGAKCDGSNDDTAAIASTVAAAEVVGAGNVILPATTGSAYCRTTATIAITKSNITLVGAGGGYIQNVTPAAANASTRLFWEGANGGTMISFISPAGAGAPKQSGGGVKGILLVGDNGATVAAKGIYIDSWANGIIEDVQLFEFSGIGLHTDAQVTLGDPSDVQRWKIDRLSCRIFSAGGACAQFDGSLTANTSFNQGSLISAQCDTQDCIVFNNSDNNNFYNVSVFMAGLGNCLVFNDGANTRANSITGYACNQTTLVKTGVSGNVILLIDADNGTPAPTLQGTGTITYTYNRKLLTQDSSGNANLVPGATFAMKGSGSGTLTQTLQAAAGTPTITWGTSTGTPAVTASSPLGITAATGNITCATCATTAGANIPTIATGDLLYGSAANTLSALADVAVLNVLISGGIGVAPAWGKVALGALATQATNTVLGNATSGSAVPTALAVGSCSTAASALIWTTNTGFGCNTSITAAAVPVGGITGLGTGVATALAVNVGTAGSFVVNGGALGSPSSAGTLPALTLGGTISGGGNQINNVIIGTSTPLAGSFTTLAASGVLTSTNATAEGVGGTGAIVSAGGMYLAKGFVTTGGVIYASSGDGVAVRSAGRASDNASVFQFTNNAINTIYGQIYSLGAATMYFSAGSTPVLSLDTTVVTSLVALAASTKIRAAGTAPALTSCGTSPTISGSDLAGLVVTGTGTPTSCTITFNVAYSSEPYCTVSTKVAARLTSYTVSTTAIVVTTTATDNVNIEYHCFARSAGWLLKRDLDPAANDNSPAFMENAA